MRKKIDTNTNLESSESNQKTNEIEKFSNLRSGAEKRLEDESKTDAENIKKLSLEEIQNIIFDLRVHQIELEMQNDELTRVYNELNEIKSRYFDLYELAPVGYLIISQQGLIMETNLMASIMLNKEREKLKYSRFSKFIYLDDESKYYRILLKLKDIESPQECELRIVKKGDQVVWVHLKIAAIKNQDEVKYRVILSDITERKRMEEQLIQNEKKFKSLVFSMDQGLALFDVIQDLSGLPIDLIFREVNSSFNTMFEITRDSCLGKRIREVIPQIESNWVDALIECAQNENPKYFEKYNQITDRYYGAYSYIPGENQLAVLYTDINERIKKEKEIIYLNYHDSLTGLYNRRFYEEELKRLDTNRNYPLTILMGDVNGLKLINDSFGHQVGDQLLIKAAGIIKTCCRSDDIVARLGGDEFIILLPQTDSDKTEKIISRIKKMSSKVSINGVPISISFGAIQKTSSNQKNDDLYKMAEDQMYSNKLSESSSSKSRMINLILSTLFEKNPREILHSQRVSDICREIATGMNLSKDEIERVSISGLMHDIGKVGIDEKLLNSDKKLSTKNLQIMRKHSEIGFRILSSVNEFSEIGSIILSHHERWNGTGYPRQIKGEEIPLLSRILSIADSFDAMTTERTYKDVLSFDEAIFEMQSCSGTQFDPIIVQKFIELIKSSKIPSITRNSN